jgi:diacylglycerol kinase family enzyme
MASRVAVIVNANARRFVQRPSRIDDVRASARDRAEVIVTRSRVELAAAIDRLRDERVDVVVLCGGDGSHAAGASEIHRAYMHSERPILAFAPGGTVGTVSRSLRVAERGPFVRAFDRVLDRACAPSPKTIETPTLLVRADDRSPEVHFIFGTGLVASFFRLYDEKGADEDAPSVAVGLLGAAAIVARIFVESFYGGAYARRVLEPMPMEIDVVKERDGAPERLPWRASSLVLASVVRDLGLHMLVPYRACEDPERPHVVVSGLSTRALGPRMTRVLRGVSIGEPGDPHFDDLCDELLIHFPDGARGPFVVDGDLRLARSVSVRAGPKLRILAPTPATF